MNYYNNYPFNTELLQTARREFPVVLCDTITREKIIGSKTATTGNRLRIYVTSWDYETPDIIYNNKDLEALLDSVLIPFV